MVSSVQDSMFQVIMYRCKDITLDLPVKQKKELVPLANFENGIKMTQTIMSLVFHKSP